MFEIRLPDLEKIVQLLGGLATGFALDVDPTKPIVALRFHPGG
jgi:hypothetical protein